MTIVEHTSSGAITCVKQVSERSLDLNLPQDTPYLVFDSDSDITPKSHYVDLTTMTVEERQPLPVTVSGFAVSDLPGPCTFFILGPVSDEVAVTDASVTLDFAVSGKYRIKITSDDPQWLEHTVEMTYDDN